MKGISSLKMRQVDQRATERFGIPALLLMENAGRGIADLLDKKVRRKSKIAVFCGKGNNGGDGLVAARHLWNRGHSVQTILAANPPFSTEESRINFNIIQRMNLPVKIVTSGEKVEQKRLQSILSKMDWIIDALFGIGLTRNLEEPSLSLIRLMNHSGKKVLCVDLPSGLNADSGKIMGDAVQASITATLGFPKKGLFKGAGLKLTGKVHVIDIGLPRR